MGPDSRRPEGAAWKLETQQADVTVTGPARSLLLILTGRLLLTDHDAPGVSVDGDTGLAQQWLDNTAHVAGCPADGRSPPDASPVAAPARVPMVVYRGVTALGLCALGGIVVRLSRCRGRH